MFLFIGDVVFGACNNPLTLDTLDSRGDQGSRQIWVGTEPFLLQVNLTTVVS